MELESQPAEEPPPSYTPRAHSSGVVEATRIIAPVRSSTKLSKLVSPTTSQQVRRPAVEVRQPWPSQNPLSAYYQPGPSHLSPKDGSPTDTVGNHATSEDKTTLRRGGSSVSLDDPDIRLAAEALADLRADFVTSPGREDQMQRRNQHTGEPEPLLSLLSTSHPLLGTAIGVPLSAYNSSKQYSTVFRSSAEYVEKRFTPVVNTVGSVGRITGVEGGVRWFLSPRRPSHHHPSEGDGREDAKKRRRMIMDHCDVEADRADTRKLDQFRSYSQSSGTAESLPAYEETSISAEHGDLGDGALRAQDGASGSWQSRLARSTSGLGVAMSDDSLRTLRICLAWLREANDHLNHLITLLQGTLEAYNALPKDDKSVKPRPETATISLEEERDVLSSKITTLKDAVLQTLKSVIQTVSRNAGAALPENARPLVRKHLTSLPQRFRIASEGGCPVDEEKAGISGQKDGSESSPERKRQDKNKQVAAMGSRMIVLAQEGLDMIVQVSGILNGTITSAEEWCDRLGRQAMINAEAIDQAGSSTARASIGGQNKALLEAESDEKAVKQESPSLDEKTPITSELDVTE